MARKRGHPVFAALWDRVVQAEGRAEREARRRVAGGAKGRVLEIGVGTGGNWPYLPEGVSYSGIEPDPYMLRRARQHAAEGGLEMDLRDAGAEALPFGDGEFDTVICTLTLCSVSDLPRSLREVRRVLKPGGEFRFREHVRPEGGMKAAAFDLLAPVWRRAAAGCNLNRRTLAALAAAGFEVSEDGRSSALGIPFVSGVATIRATGG